MKIIDGVLTNVKEEDIINGTFIIPSDVTCIGNFAFYDCKNLIKLDIPEQVTCIDNDAFRNCYLLESITLSNNLTKLGNGVFYNCSALKQIDIPNGIPSIEDWTFYGCSSLTSIHLPDCLMSIGNLSFRECKSLKNISIPDGVVSIGYSSFQDCSSLSSITLPNNIKRIENSTFCGCRSLESVSIPDGVVSIGYSSFQDCSSLVSITLPNDIKRIESSTFCGCKSLRYVNNLHNITSIGYSAFKDCSSLLNIDLKEGIKRIENATFYGCKDLKSITIPQSTVSIGDSAFRDCQSLENINMPNQVTSISNSAFRGCHLLSSVTIPENIMSIGEFAFDDCINLDTLVTSWDKLNLQTRDTNFVIISYLYLYANSILKEKYNSLEKFLSNDDIRKLMNSNEVFSDSFIQKFKNIFYRVRKQYDITPDLLMSFKLETSDEFDYKIWNQIKNAFNWRDSHDMAKAFSEMIEVFGLFHKDSKIQQRVNTFQNLFIEEPFIITKEEYSLLSEEWQEHFKKIKVAYWELKNNAMISELPKFHLKQKLSEKDRKQIKKETGHYGKKINDFVKNNYKENYEEHYELISTSVYLEELKKNLFYQNFIGHINYSSLHRMFDGCSGLYDEEFYEFLIENLPLILNDEILERDVKNIQKHFKSIKKHYLYQAGIENITLQQAIDYINSKNFDYRYGNLELLENVKKAGVTEQESFDYYQEVYEKNDVRKLYSLVRRSNIYEINGYTIKAELLRKDDSFGMLVGEKNYTNCCQIFGGVGHNCMAHAVSSDDGGIFVTKLLKDGEWILLTESWDWQNNNLYCHDNIEGTSYFKNGDSSLKEAVIKAIELDGKYIIEESENSVEKYVETRRKVLEKSISSNKEKELEELRELEKRAVIKVVTVGTRNNALAINDWFKTFIKANQTQILNEKQFTLINFQPVNYDSSQIYFNPEKSAYSDAKDTQAIVAGSIEELCLSKLEPLVPIYRDERRIIVEEKDNIRDYTIKKVLDIKHKVYPEIAVDYKKSYQDSFNSSKIYLGEDWYLVYEEQENNSIYISDFASVTPTLEDEQSKQISEIVNAIYFLIKSYDKVIIKSKKIIDSISPNLNIEDLTKMNKVLYLQK